MPLITRENWTARVISIEFPRDCGTAISQFDLSMIERGVHFEHRMSGPSMRKEGYAVRVFAIEERKANVYLARVAAIVKDYERSQKGSAHHV